MLIFALQELSQRHLYLYTDIYSQICMPCAVFPVSSLLYSTIPCAEPLIGVLIMIHKAAVCVVFSKEPFCAPIQKLTRPPLLHLLPQ